MRELTQGGSATGASQEAVAGESTIAAASRLHALDLHRGIIMAIMAIDHASFFIARAHSEEFWGAALPVYPNALWFWTRWITHVCAPGFCFLMGVGMILLADTRRKRGWDDGRIRRFFVTRGLLLILLQMFVEDPAWLLGIVTAQPGVTVERGGPVPGGGGGVMIHFGVLFSLGAGMVFWAFLLKARSWVIVTIGLAAVLVTQLAIPGKEQTTGLYSPVLRLLIIPGHTNAWQVFYPVVPWLGAIGLGLIFGRLLTQDVAKAVRIAGWTSLSFLILFLITRTAGGFGNLNGVPTGWMGFLNVVKYPPSLAYLAVTLAVNLAGVAIWTRVEPRLRNRRNPCLVFGQAAMLFYLLHLWVYCLIGLFFRSGSDLAAMYGVWLLGLGILYPVCYYYNRFKRGTPVTSLWRFF